ncbi:glycosyltransferase [Rubrimonas cliftonensis]|uniref:Glycosyltransferase like family 2 n=1 Tax=Rubrimonas cliftonensis TaxID=89524 RepID=A0A1H3VFK5_9RHOB|nr:glycosyltransferase [Rubrimonas cliftonensis]SDZ72922.1 Glycosyltransferase like family 2 [Rubrimonas cliftonensis]
MRQGAAEGVTAVLTSCGRMRQLGRLLESLRAFNDHPLARFILMEDSGDAEAGRIAADLGFDVELHLAQQRRGQLASIDYAYARVETPWILHLEDDYVFTRPGYVAEALAVLRADPRVSMVSGRVWGEEFAGTRPPVTAVDGVRVRLIPRDAHPSWFGYAFHTGLRRKREWERFGPFAPYRREWDVSYAMKRAGMRMAYLVEPAYHDDDLGEQSASSDPARPARAASLGYKFSKSAKKALFRVERALGRYRD